MKKGTEALLREDGRRLILVVVLSFGILFAGAKLCFCGGGKIKIRLSLFQRKPCFFAIRRNECFCKSGSKGVTPLVGLGMRTAEQMRRLPEGQGDKARLNRSSRVLGL